MIFKSHYWFRDNAQLQMGGFCLVVILARGGSGTNGATPTSSLPGCLSGGAASVDDLDEGG